MVIIFNNNNVWFEFKTRAQQNRNIKNTWLQKRLHRMYLYAGILISWFCFCKCQILNRIIGSKVAQTGGTGPQFWQIRGWNQKSRWKQCTGKKKRVNHMDFLTQIVPHRSFTPVLYLPYPQLHSYSCSSLIKSSLVHVKPCKCCEQNTRFHQPY